MNKVRPAFRFSCLAAVVLFCAGCSTLGVKVDKHPGFSQRVRERRIVAKLDDTSGAGDELRAALARGLTPKAQLCHFLKAASLSERGAIAGEPEAKGMYNLALTHIIRILERDNFASQAVSSKEGTWHVGVKNGRSGTLDPAQSQLIVPAVSVHIKGLHERSVQQGFGVPYVLGFSRDSSFLVGQPGLPRGGLAVPATAVLRIEGRVAWLEFRDTLSQDTISLHGRKVRLATDFSAPLAVVVSQTANRSIDIKTFLLTRQHMGGAGLFQFQPYDPKKIPVVFVHGLLSRPEAWVQACNTLLADPTIRQHYQFWFMLYPTGLPLWSSAALLRVELDRFHRELERDASDPNLHQVVLVGHSMGGLIASLNMRQSGKKFWRRFSNQPFQKLSLSFQSRRQIENLIFFPPRTDIGRVVFIATPHRGSQMALNPAAVFLARLIRLPEAISRSDRALIVEALNPDYRNLLSLPANSIRFLKADSPIIEAIRNLPLAHPIPYHSIIGDRGRGDSPNSSDGVVAYWSSHLEGAASEKIVPSDHGANENPEAIMELRRILIENLRKKSRP